MTTSAAKSRWVIFPIWVSVVYFSYIAVIMALSLLKGHFAFSLFASWRGQALVLIPSVFPAVIGTMILCVSRIEHAWLGIGVGSLLGAAGLVFSTWVEVKLLGSFEANPGIVLEFLIMLLPTCIAGAYAGFAWASFYRQ